MIPESIHSEILSRLAAAEHTHQVKILYACESGSRAWGFASPDSDFDVRFIYVRNEDWYLSFDIERRRDVIEYPIVDEIDCGGWDIRKALYLFTRTNGALLEWLHSPIKYIECGSFAQHMRELAPQAFNEIALCYHYSHMARGNAREHLSQAQVKLKKYFYVLRPLLAIRYIQQHHLPPPIEFEQLLTAVAPAKLIPHVERLLALKRETPELGMGNRVDAINDFVEAEFERHGNTFHGHDRPGLLDDEQIRMRLNEIFRQQIRG